MLWRMLAVCSLAALVSGSLNGVGYCDTGQSLGGTRDNVEAREQQPPFDIGGAFKYAYGHKTHVFACDDPSCVKGSRVSYMLIKPEPKMTFEEYKALRIRLAAGLKQRTPDVEYIFSEPVDKSDTVFTLYESQREERGPGGAVNHVVSNLLYTSRVGIDLISSGPDRKAVDDNLNALFLAATLWTASLEEQAKGKKAN